MLRRPGPDGPKSVADRKLQAAGFRVFGDLGCVLRLVPGLLCHLLKVHNNCLGLIQELIEGLIELWIFSGWLATSFRYASSWTRLVLDWIDSHIGEWLLHGGLNDWYLVVFVHFYGVLGGVCKGFVIVSTCREPRCVFVEGKWLDAPSLVALGRSKLLPHHH